MDALCKSLRRRWVLQEAKLSKITRCKVSRSQQHPSFINPKRTQPNHALLIIHETQNHPLDKTQRDDAPHIRGVDSTAPQTEHAQRTLRFGRSHVLLLYVLQGRFSLSPCGVKHVAAETLWEYLLSLFFGRAFAAFETAQGDRHLSHRRPAKKKRRV